MYTITQLRILIKERSVVIPSNLDRRYKNTLIYCLGLEKVEPVYKNTVSITKKLDYISKWDWAWKTSKDSESERFISITDDINILTGFEEILNQNNPAKIRRVFYIILKIKDYLFEELFDLVIKVNPSKFSVTDIKGICLDIMTDDEEEVQFTAYQLLQVNKNVSKVELKSVYKNLCKVHHPDVNEGGGYEYFNKITHAYQEILGSIARK